MLLFRWRVWWQNGYSNSVWRKLYGRDNEGRSETKCSSQSKPDSESAWIWYHTRVFRARMRLKDLSLDCNGLGNIKTIDFASDKESEKEDTNE